MTGKNIRISKLLVKNRLKLECSRWYANTHFFTFDLGVVVTQNVAVYHPHHVTHGPEKFEVPMSNG